MSDRSFPNWSLRPIRSMLRLYPFLNGTGQMIDRTFLKRLTVPSETLVAKTKSGYPLRVFPNEMIGRNVFLAGRFDPTIAAVLRSFARPGDSMLDVGANIGVVSCELLHHLPDLKSLSVEPQPRVFALLKENLARFGSRAKSICAGMSDRSGDATMRVNHRNLGGSGIEEDVSDSDRSDSTLSIQIRTAPEILASAEFESLDIVKIDVEGHQLQVIRSLESSIDRFQPRVVLFEHDGEMSDPEEPIRKIFDGLGYRVEGISKRLNGWRSVDVDSNEGRDMTFNDYIAVPA